jgi:AcrR family transcriptional regulator
MSPASDEPREQLLSAAGEIFADKGFAATTIRDICGRAGANVAAVNYYFRDKLGLYIEAVKRAHCSQVTVDFDTLPHASTAQKLHLFVTGMLTHLLDDSRPTWHARLMMRELAEPTEACTALVESYIRPMALELEKILREVVPSHNRADFYMFGFSVVAQCLFYRVQRPIAEVLVGPAEYAQYTVPKLAEHITRFSLSGLCLSPDFTPLSLPGMAPLPEVAAVPSAAGTPADHPSEVTS